ncbi:MAG: CDP-alcohol phosphatidyltransferase family protein [Candidatus Thorarchaeota archaeon]
MPEKNDRLKKIPFAIAFLRIPLTPLFFYAFIIDLTLIAIILYLAAAISDIVDGRLAQWLNIESSSSFEAYLDPLADFVLVIGSFYAFSLKQIYPTWILFVLIFMFLFFILSSNREKPRYDPLGKYYGIFLIVSIGLTLLIPMELLFSSILLSIIGYTLALIIYRTAFLWKYRMTEE